MGISVAGGVSLPGSLSFYTSPPPPSGYELWTWGENESGNLGDGTIVKRSSPVQIGALADWASIDAGGGSSLAVKTDGSLWSWGSGSDGKLGDGTIINKSSPVQIGSDTNWIDIGNMNYHCIALKSGS